MTLDILRKDPMGAREPGEPGNLRKPYEMVCRVVFTYIELMLSGFLSSLLQFCSMFDRTNKKNCRKDFVDSYRGLLKLKEHTGFPTYTPDAE